MKKAVLFSFILLLAGISYAQTTVFLETFEPPLYGDSVTSSQTTTGVDDWGISTALYNSGSASDTCQVIASTSAYLTTNSFSTLNNSNVFLEFAHICKVDFQDAAEIEVSINNGQSWTKLTSSQYMGSGQFGTLGDKFSAVSYVNDWNPSSATAIPTNSWWKTEQFEISSLAGNQANVKIRFKLTDGGISGSGGNYGWLIDDIKVTMSYSELVPPTVALQTPVIIDSVYYFGPFDIYADITDASGIDTAYLIYSRNNGADDTLGMLNTSGNTYLATIDTIPAFSLGDTVCYRVLAYDASPAQNYAGDPSSGCNQFVIYSSPPPPGCTTPITTFPIIDGFETGYGNWVNTTGDQMDWTRHSGGTSSYSTGPNGANGGTYYVYTETSGYNNMTAYLLGPCVNLTVLSAPKIEFYYHMYGATMGTLELQIYYGGTWITIWSKSGQQHTSNGDPWTKAEVNLIPYKSITQLRFKALTGTSYTSDMCVDDIKIWEPPANDAGLVEIVYPVNPALTGIQPVAVKMVNYGSANLTSDTIFWMVDSVMQPPFVWTGMLPPQDTVDSLAIGTYNFPVGQSSIIAWTASPNGQPDGFVYNDTTSASIIACTGPLSGVYTLGGSSPDYTDFDAAFEALTNCGVDSHVVFNVASGTYTGQLSLDPVFGSADSATITFQSATGNPADVTISYNGASSSTDNWVLQLNGADYIHFKNLTIKSTNTGNYGGVIQLDNAATYNVFDGCNIISNGATSSYARGVYSYNTLNHYTAFRNCNITDAYYGFYVRGTSSVSSGLVKGFTIQNCNITDFYYYGLYLYYHDSIQVLNNFIKNSSNSASYPRGIYAYYCDGMKRIVGNNIQMSPPSYSYGMYIYYNDGVAGKPGIIANNFISIDGGTGAHYAMYLYGCTYQTVANNSINVNGGSASSYAFRLYSTSSNNIEILNNNFVSNSGYAYYVYTPSSVTASDFNNIYSTGSNFAYWGTSASSLAALQSLSGKDTASISVDPGFVSTTDLHINSLDLDGAAMPLPYVLDDIDGEPRDTANPDMGADEFILLGDDAGVIAFEPPSLCPGPNLIFARVKNYGTDTLFSTTVKWAVNGIMQDSAVMNDTLLTLQEVLIPLDTFVFVAGTNYNLDFWTVNPNGIPDLNTGNDSLSVIGLQTALPAGIYTIGPDPNDDYSTFNGAVSDLNAYGICGPVTFLVDSGSYNENVVFNEISGASSVNTITFKSFSGNKNDVILSYGAASSTDNYVLQFDGADYVQFKQITLKATGASYGYVVYLLNGATNNLISGCTIETGQSTSSNFRGIYNYGVSNYGNTFKNNDIKNGYYGIYAYGGGTTSLQPTNYYIDNTITDFYYYGMYMYYMDSVVVRGNYIANGSNAASYPYGVYMRYNDNGCIYDGNTIEMSGSSYSRCIYSYYCDGTSAEPNYIMNNFFIINAGTSTNYGIYMYYAYYTNIYHNSFNITSGNTSSRGIYQSSGGNINIMNNIFSMPCGGYGYYLNTPTAISNSDYNDFYSTGSYIAYWSGSHSTLSSLQSSSGKEAHSLNIDPSYMASDDLHINNMSLKSAGTDVGVLFDIDGDTRDSLPDIGADEFIVLANDAGIASIVNPTAPCPGIPNDIIVELKNYGTDTLFNALIQWTFNGVPQGNYPVTDTILPGNSVNVQLDTSSFYFGQTYDLVFWSKNPNAVPDSNNANDTAAVYNLKTALSTGNYTIGGDPNDDYANFSAAISDLNLYGVCGPVVFLVDSGSYNEQIEIGEILGASAVNTVTFKSATGDSTDVELYYASISSSANYVVYLNGADYIRFENMTIKSTASSYAYVVRLESSATHNEFTSCIIESIFSTSSYAMALYIYGADVGHNTFRNNDILNGYYGVYAYGSSSSSLQPSNVYDNNNITGWYYYGLYLYYQDSVIVNANHIQHGTTSASYPRAIYAYYCDNGREITGNNIVLSGSSYSYGIYSYYNDGTSSEPGLIANNFISISSGTSTNYGIYCYSNNYQNIYYNSINITSGSTTSRCLYVSSGGNITLLNNIFSAAGGGYAYYVSSSYAISQSDYNNIWSTGGTLAYWSGTHSTLTSLQSSSSQESHSVSTDPMFFSASDLHTVASGINNLATPIALIQYDIDGQVRDTANPDIGADEFVPTGLNAAAIEFIKPVDGCGLTTDTVILRISNVGGDTITDSLSASYQILGSSTVVTESVTDTLIPGDTLAFAFTTLINLSTTVDTTFDILGWVDLAGDPMATNDTTNTSVFSGVMPPDPIVSDTTIPYGSFVTISAQASDTIFWYADPMSDSIIGGGSTYTTPVLYDTITYWAQAVSGTAGGTLKITEINTNSPDFVEIQNVANTTVDYTGWKVIISDDYSNINDVNTLTWDLGVMQPHEVQYREDQTGSNYWGNNIFWSSGSSSWAAIINDQGEIVDYIAWGWTDNAIQGQSISIAGYTGITVGSQWTGNGPSASCSSSIARQGSTDNNTAADWSCITTSKGTQNSGYTPTPGGGAGGSLGCGSNKVPLTVYVMAIPPYDPGITSLSVNSGCALTQTEPVTIGITNIGTDTITSSQGLTATYSVNNGPYITPESVSMMILPGDTVYYTFTATVNMQSPTTDSVFNFNAHINLTGDPNQLNDSIQLDSVESLATPMPPTVVSPVNIPYASPATLTATPANVQDSLFWFDVPAGGTEIGQGSTYVTPLLYGNTTYYVEAVSGGVGGTYTLGTGTTQNTTTSYPCPYGQWYNGTKEQFLILASELNALGMTGGAIHSIAFDVVTPAGASLTNFEIKIGSTNLTSLSSWVTTGLTSVYSNSSYTTTTGWNTHQFSIPFVWDGTSNIVIETCFDNYPTGYTTNALMNQTSTSFTSTLDYHSDGGGVCTNSVSSTSYQQRPNMQIVASGGNCPSTRVPVQVNVSNPPPIDAGAWDVVNPVGTVQSGMATPVQARFRNFGTNTLTSATIHWEVNGVPKAPYSWTGSLLSDSISAPITVGVDTFPGGFNCVKIWTSMPNNVADTSNLNDTIIHCFTACLNGTYTLGTSTSDFQTFGEALLALDSIGVCGDVTFLVQPGTYSQSLTINQVNGVDANNTVTFRGSTGDSTDVVITYGGTSGSDYTLKLNGAEYFRFKNLTFKNTNTSSGVIQIYTGANHNIISNCVIECAVSSSSLARNIYDYSGIESYNEIRYNHIKNGYYSIYLYGSSTASLESGIIIEGNVIEDFYYYGIYARYMDSLIIKGNTFSNGSGSAAYPRAMYLYYCDNGREIVGNDIQLTPSSYGYGIYSYYNDGNSTERGLIANNFISIQGGTSTNYGIYMYNNSYQDIYYNSINITGGSTSSRCFYLSSGSNINNKNNIFANTGGGYAYYISTTSALLTSDYNNLYATGTNLAYWSGNRATLAALQSASSKETYSKSVDPQFVSATELHINTIDLNAAATPVSNVTVDIDNEPRHATTPDIGADEFTPSPNDAGIVSIDAPLTPAFTGSQNVKVTLRNYGADTLNSVTINWSVNDTLQTPYAWTGTLLTSQQQDTITVGQYSFNAGQSCIKAWPTNPNGQPDGFPFNDTAESCIIACTGMMSGTYTIGGTSPDFIDFNGALLGMTSCGINGPVTFNVAAGTYVEQLTITAIPGASATNTVTFQSASGDSTDVVLSYGATSTADNWVVMFDGGDYITFKQISIVSTSSGYYGRVVIFDNGADNNTITNCELESVSATSSYACVIYSYPTSTYSSYNIIKNNKMTNGYYSVYWRGSSSSAQAKSNRFEGNIMTGWYYYGMYLYYHDAVQVVGNELENSSSSGYLYGMYLYYCDNDIVVSKNKLNLHGSSTNYGIRLYYCDGTSIKNGLISNNFVAVTGTSTSTHYAVYCYNSNWQNFVYNSIHLAAGGSSARGLYFSSGGNIKLINNNVVNTSGGYTIYASSSYAITYSDYNNWYTTGSNLGYWSGTATNLAMLQILSLKDSNSVSVDPGFNTDADLHVVTSALNALATPTPLVSDDIDNTLRDTLSPDIGADEFTPLNLDAALKEIVEPSDGWDAVGSTKDVVVLVRNQGIDTISNFSVGYIVPGQSAVLETYTDTLLPGVIDTFSFTTQMSPIAGQFNFCVFTALTGDQNNNNDTNCITYSGVPVLQIPYFDDFESTNYFFSSGGLDEWEWGVPNGGTINSAHSPSHAWVTNLNGYYSNGANGYLYTPKFNLSTYGVDSLKVWHWMSSEMTNDGGNIQYLNIQGNWNTLGGQNDTNAYNWYNTYSSGQERWSGQTGGWMLSTYDLSVVNDLGSITQFRFAFNSNTSNNSYDGWAVDDFELTIPKIPEDAGVIDVILPGDTTTLGATVTVQAEIHNFGLDTLFSIPIKYVRNQGIPKTETWTGVLPPNASFTYTFNTTYSGPTNDYNFCVYTDVPNDVYSFNDSLCNYITVQLPAFDAGVVEILFPTDTTLLNTDYNIQVRIKNYGLNTITNTQLSYKFKSNPAVAETWTGTLSPGDSVDYIFQTPYNSTLLIGNYNICVFTNLSNDGYHLNDTVCENLLNIVGMHELDLDKFWLGQNLPNPANKFTSIEYHIPHSGTVRFEVLDVLGKLMIANETDRSIGKHTVELDISDLPSGIYYYALEFEGVRLVRKMIISK